MAYVIAISGVSRSGKSSLARKIKDRLSGKKVLLMDMDDFVFPKANSPKIQDRTDWEHPLSVNYDQILAAIDKHQDNYDIIIIEGILVMTNEPLKTIYDFTIYLQLSKKTFMKRRKEETRWGAEPDWYLEHVWNSYLKFGQYPKADLILSGETEITLVSLNSILSNFDL